MEMKVKVYADWQPGYMGEPIHKKTAIFENLKQAEPTIDLWNKTACNVIVSEYEERIISKYVWGELQKPKKENHK